MISQVPKCLGLHFIMTVMTFYLKKKKKKERKRDGHQNKQMVTQFQEIREHVNDDRKYKLVSKGFKMEITTRIQL